jgi:hypothetical protein
MNFFELKGEGYTPSYTCTNFTDSLHDAFGFCTDSEITTSQMKKIFKLTKKPIKGTHFLFHAKTARMPILPVLFKRFSSLNCQRWENLKFLLQKLIIICRITGTGSLIRLANQGTCPRDSLKKLKNPAFAGY